MQDVNHQLFTESVMEEVLLSLKTSDVTHAIEILKSLDLEKEKDTHPMALSGGQKQRVAIATAIASGRDIIVFDEPTSGLDLKHMEEIAENIKSLKRRGKTIFIVTDDPELVSGCCDYFIFMEQGHVKWHGKRESATAERLNNFFGEFIHNGDF